MAIWDWLPNPAKLTALERWVAERTSGLAAEMIAWRDARETFRQVTETVPAAIVMVNGEGKIELVNAETERTFGYSREELLGRSVDILLPDSPRASDERHPAGFPPETAPGPMETRQDPFARRKDGSEFAVEIALNSMTTAKGRKIIASIFDITRRKRIENTLGDSERRMKLMFDSIRGVAVFMLDREGRIVSWNLGAERLKGYEENEILGRHFSLFYPPEDVAKGKPEALIAAARGGRVEDEGWRLRKDGSRFIANVIISAAKDSGGDLQGFVKVTRDITERKTIETELVETNERFSLAAAAAGLAFWDLDLDARTLRGDDRMFQLYGLDRPQGEQPRELWMERLHPEDRAKVEEETREAIEGRRTFDTEFRIVRPDGDVRRLRAHANFRRDSAGRAFRMFGVNFDITERKRIESELIETSTRLRNALAAASEVAIIATDPQLLITVFNAGAEKLLGYAGDEMIGRATLALFHDPGELAVRAEELGRDLGRRVEGGAVFTEPTTLQQPREWTYLRKDGRAVRVSLVVTAVRSDGGELLGYLGIAHDVTREKEAEQKFLAAKSEAERANLAKSAFLASMSHEIRTPMNGVIGFADLLLDSDLTPQQRGHASRLQDAAKSLVSLINDILDLSKIEAGKLEIEMIPTNPETVVQGAASVVRAQMAAKGLELRIEMAPEAPDWIEGDPTRLRQILLNLLSNALKFTDLGRIVVRCLRQFVGNEEFLRFEVEDSGIGIPADRQHLLFQGFSQVDRSTTRRYGGTGLGLSICRRLALAMGGDIGVISVVGKGSTIWFTIRLRTCEAPDLSMAGDPSDLVANPARVLVADDLGMNRDIVETMLRRAGHSPRGVENGRQAVIAVQEDDFDLVLMDMEMPDMDGIEATRAIRRLDERIRHIPVVALTANAFSKDRERCRAAGMNDFLPKPVNRDALLAMVAKWSGEIPPKRAAPAPGANVLDRVVLDDFDNALGVEAVARFMGKFRAQVRDAVAVLTTVDDPASIAREAHKLVNLASNLGCVELASLARTLCSEAKSENGDVNGLLIAVPPAVDRAVAALASRYA